MLAAFWSGLGGEFAKQWAARILTPAFAFWAGGLAAIWWHSHGRAVQAHGWPHELSATASWLHNLPGLAQGILVVAGLLLVAVSALAAERLTLPLLRLMEGYGWHPHWLRDRLISYRRWRYHRWDARVGRLATRQQIGTLKPEEFFELADLEADPPPDPARLRELQQRRADGLDARMMAQLGQGRSMLRSMPRQDALGMPTRLGDILRAAERRPADKYGLDTIACWTALWLLLPAEAKTELVQARSALDNAARTWLWGALFVVWIPWTWLALPVAIVVPALAYYMGILTAATLFGDLTVAAYDLHRTALYQQLRWPLPSNPRQERSAGAQLTSYLYSGSDSPTPTFSSVGNGPQPIAELRGTVERAVLDSLDAARSEPVLANWSGQVGARIESSDGRHADRLTAGLDYQLLVTFSRHLSEDFECRSIDVRGGRDIDPVAFELLLDSDTAVFPPMGRELLVPADGTEMSVKYSFKAPQQAGELRLWIQVLQLNRLLQALTVTVSVDKPEEPVK